MSRRLGWLVLEVAVIALIYTVASVLVGATALALSGVWDLTRLFVINLIAVLSVAAFVWWADGTWWSVGATAVMTLMVLQVLVPHLETALERQASLGHLPLMTVRSLVAALIAVGALLFFLPDDGGFAEFPPTLLVVGGLGSYLWRVLVLTASYALVHVAMMRFGRGVFGQAGRAALAEEFLHRVLCGLVVVAVLVAVAAHLPAGGFPIRLFLVLIPVLVCLAGRLAVVAGWPLDMAATRVGLRAGADLVAGVLAIWLLLPRGGEGATQAQTPDDPASPEPDPGTGLT